MRTFGLAILLLALCAWTAAPCSAQTAATQREPIPGVRLAEGVTQLTGVAISPLTGVSVVGAWHYFRAPEAQRPHLPWYAHPLFWGCGLLLVSLSFLKDAFGPAIPHALKKPLDALDLLQSQASGILATIAFVPSVVGQMMEAVEPSGGTAAMSPEVGFVTAGLGAGLTPLLFAIPVAIAGFATVWLTFHTINVLILLSPSAFIDSLLKLMKGVVLVTLVAAAAISPVLGVLVALLIIVVATLLAPWAMRFTVFGSLVGLDLFIPSIGRDGLDASQPRVFLARSYRGRPTRTYGRLIQGPRGEVLFAYRPWFILAERTVPVTESELLLARGLVLPTLCYRDGRSARAVRLFTLLPRYRRYEDEIAAHLGIPDVIDGSVTQGIRAMKTWWNETIGLSFTRVAQQ